MAWTDIFRRRVEEEAEEKLNPAQDYIANGNSGYSKEVAPLYTTYYERLEVVNRGVNLIVDACASIPHKIDGSTGGTPVVRGVRKKTLNTLLNYEPNPYMDVSTFRTNLYVDYILDGNIFIYWDGVHLYHIPANLMVVEPDERTYIKEYRFNTITFKPTEIIHIKDNSFYTVYRGTSRLRSAVRSMSLMSRMGNFQENFFTNGAIPGVVLKSPHALSDKIKERMTQSWKTKFNPEGGARQPVILDNGLELDKITNINFRELDFEASIQESEKKILKALGVPPILLDSGNNANITPNLRLFYLETVLPIVNKVNSGLQRFFGYDIYEDLTHIASMQPDLSEQASYFATLVNNGIITPNEARFELGREPVEGFDEIRVPANVAGSASDPSQGGRPPKDKDE